MSWLDNFFIKEIDDNGIKKPNQPKLNFIGATVTDNPLTHATDVDVAAATNVAVIFDTLAGNTNIRSNRSTTQSPIDNTKVGIVNLGSRSSGASVGVLNNYGAILSGDKHGVSGEYSIIGGGWTNTISDAFSAILGGEVNIISSTLSSIVGGFTNTITTSSCFIGGGNNNTVSGERSVINGGNNNLIDSSVCSIIGCGSYNTINPSDGYNLICGGNGNTVSGDFSAILGGINNTTNNNHNLIMLGDTNTAGGLYGSILNGTDNSISTNVSTGYSLIGNGSSNSNSPNYNTILNGNTNIIDTSAQFSTIINGENNTVPDQHNIVAGASNLITIDVTEYNVARFNTIFGYSNNLDGSSVCTVIGYNNVIAGDCSESIVLGHGHSISVGSNNSMSIGQSCSVRMPGQLTYSNQTVSLPGDAQMSILGLYGSGSDGYAFYIKNQNDNSNISFENEKSYSITLKILVNDLYNPTLCSYFIYDILAHCVSSSLVLDAVNTTLSQSTTTTNITLGTSTNEMTILVGAYGASTRNAIAKVEFMELTTLSV